MFATGVLYPDRPPGPEEGGRKHLSAASGIAYGTFRKFILPLNRTEVGLNSVGSAYAQFEGRQEGRTESWRIRRLHSALRRPHQYSAFAIHQGARAARRRRGHNAVPNQRKFDHSHRGSWLLLPKGLVPKHLGNHYQAARHPRSITVRTKSTSSASRLNSA